MAAAATRAAEDSAYTAFENRFRGSRDEIRRRLGDYAERFAGCAPVADLGCGRGEFLEVLRERGIAARGVEGNANVVRECREKGLDVAEGDLVDFLRAQARGLASAGSSPPRSPSTSPRRSSAPCSPRLTASSAPAASCCSRPSTPAR